ncbi:NMD3-domain-containing protein [Nadsonia fulvescens var. elongata DSM 6958]|uniref:60S ribosomal export protein NMD3 n=1 Tax=Nadsonia fulvescens var. elongata DSM 6958 TaxID=857566 RepID=A0A1E3PNP3_9ASCO|nr:NMD3-domain-containing protein [Nadsonia fulvescens var. elongata DSM 6958]
MSYGIPSRQVQLARGQAFPAHGEPGHVHNHSCQADHTDSQALLPMSQVTILCCNCGTPMDGSLGSNTCYDCIKLTVDITEGIPREANLSFCRNCERFLQPPEKWIAAAPESRELLALCLRKLRGLAKVRLVDAKFIWTEPHSRRIRMKITIQGEAGMSSTTIIQQSFEVEFIVIACQCPDCAKSFTVNTWRANVQIRQKVPHKRTFLYLEQLILKHNAHLDTISIKENRDGLDFYYNQRNHAMKIIDFLDSVAPIKYKRSEELISMDTHTAVKQYKFSFSVEIAPICKDDLIVLPLSIARSLGNISQLVICSKVTNSLQFIDPNTLQVASMSAGVYWGNPFPSLADATRLIEFFILDIEPLGPTRGKYALADIQIMRASELSSGSNGETYLVRTHLGGILHPGDSVLGYFIQNSNYNDRNWDKYVESKGANLADVMLVRKFYPKRKKNKNRNWKIKRMAKEHNLEDDVNATKADIDKAEVDFEMFLQEIEEDNELRENINLYKKTAEAAKAAEKHVRMAVDQDDEDEGDDIPEIGIDELLDDLEDMTLEDAK